MDIIIASNNKGKIKEFKNMLEPLGFTVYSQNEKNINIEVEETGTTFEENAFLKAKAISDKTNECVLSDDSGLEVEALNNEPGIYSARYKGLDTSEKRNKAILDQLEDKENRKARFICCICYIDKQGEKHIFKGIWNGKIAKKADGTNGFGYDPIFIAEESENKTIASMSNEFKDKYSHRAKALQQLLEYLKNK